MSLFRPFARRTAVYKANVPIADDVPPPVPEPQADNTPPEATPAPAENRAPPHRTPTPAEERAHDEAVAAETENRVRGQLREEWTRAVDTLNTAQRMADALANQRRTVLRDSAELVAEVAVVLAERVIRGTLNVSDEALAEVVRNAAQALPTDPVRVRVAPGDVERLGALLPPKLKSVVVADPSIDGGCIAETKRASVDATLDAVREGIAEVIDQWKLAREAE